MQARGLVILFFLIGLVSPASSIPVSSASTQSYNVTYHVSINGVPAAVINCVAGNAGIDPVKYESLSRLGAANKNVLVKLLESVSKATPREASRGAVYPIVYVSNGKNYIVKTNLYYRESGGTGGIIYSVNAYYVDRGLPALILLKQRSGAEFVEVRVTLIDSSAPFPGSINLNETLGVRLAWPLSLIVLIGAFAALARISEYRVDKWYGWVEYEYRF